VDKFEPQPDSVNTDNYFLVAADEYARLMREVWVARKQLEQGNPGVDMARMNQNLGQMTAITTAISFISGVDLETVVYGMASEASRRAASEEQFPSTFFPETVHPMSPFDSSDVVDRHRAQVDAWEQQN
jgi:hypothetical protein